MTTTATPEGRRPPQARSTPTNRMGWTLRDLAAVAAGSFGAGEGGFAAVEEIAPGVGGRCSATPKEAVRAGPSGPRAAPMAAVRRRIRSATYQAASSLVPGRSSRKASASRRATVSPARQDSWRRPAKACRRRSPTA